MDDVSDKIRDIIAVELQIPRERVTHHAVLREDLGMDSIAAVNILYAAEGEFDLLPIDTRALESVQTVADVVTLVRGLIPARG